MDTDTRALLRSRAATETCPKRKGIIKGLLAWIARQWGRIRDFFRRRRTQQQPADAKTLDEPNDDGETVAVSVCELPEPTKATGIAAPAATVKKPVSPPLKSKIELTAPKTKKEVPILSVAEPVSALAPKAVKPTKVGPPKTEEVPILSVAEPLEMKESFPATMEAAMDMNANNYSRRASLPANPKSMSKETRRASYAIGGEVAKPRPSPARKPSIQWVESAPALLKKTEASEAMIDGSLERSITRIHEDDDPRLAWEKPEWAKEKKLLRKSFSHNLW